MNEPYNDLDVQAHTNWLRDSDDSPSAWAQAVPGCLEVLTPAERRAVDAFYEGENVFSSSHPSRKSFSRAKAKLAVELDGYETLTEPEVEVPADLLELVGIKTRRSTVKLRHSIEGSGRSFPVQAIVSDSSPDGDSLNKTGRIAKGLPRA
ncbi:hypothetical protein AD006_01115 [Pseudonocardia sp. EC080610-09]|nr:hypothetical protein FRP1_21945 [Pseudonocardia sp. EC080625-04]ALL74268.1 hypothetical protein AD006_01115 [Pseudonocardia sp. EC080610-09]ALL81291.1 hypothetical protein AD017_08940 [Pseudonocardia sp. EC080619-01]